MPVAIWNQFNPRERLSAIGAGLVVLSWIVSLITYTIGANSLALILAIAVIAILYIKYAPNMKVNWPADVSLIILAISGLVALVALLDVLTGLRILGFYGAGIIALLLEVVGAAVLLWGAWQEYQIVKPAMPNFGAGTGTPTSPPPPAPPSQPTSAPPMSPPPPPAAPPPDDMDQRPPA